MRKKLVTKEEKVAVQLCNILADLRLDLDMIGKYLVQLSPNVIYNRLIILTDSAEAEKEDQHNDYDYRLRH
jgi:hypothetical protein